MRERKYSVREIDALRQAVETKWLWGTYYFPQRDGAGFSRSYKETDKVVAVEQMVRTHMAAGHTAEDLLASERRPAIATVTEGRDAQRLGERSE